MNHTLQVGDRVCFQGYRVSKYGRIDEANEHKVHIVWEDGGPPTWLSRRQVYFAPDEDEVRERAEALKPWRG